MKDDKLSKSTEDHTPSIPASAAAGNDQQQLSAAEDWLEKNVMVQYWKGVGDQSAVNIEVTPRPCNNMAIDW